ncbi:hypothetical protein BLA13014_06418 [Burkholderia aenigmatica]|uniref:Uncharacterized protein n=1 Tax=Burkholderia aenigmatica TaxID=2015348 RepID=A0A6P2RQ58_9BURK|nr:hypothetical protein BLA13014_06418 [Burkholderia aenigmatica]
MHSASSPFQGGYPHLGERVVRCRTHFRNARHFGSRPKQDIRTFANPPADPAIATTSKYTTLRISSNAEYPHRCERRGRPADHTHHRNAQRFESIPGRISTPWRTRRSMPHSLSKFSAHRVPTKAGYSHLSESPNRSRDRNHLEIHDASRLCKRRISTPRQAPRPPRRSHSPSKCTALRVHSRARYPHLSERLVRLGARTAPRHPQHAESLAGTGYYIETGAPFTSMVDIHLRKSTVFRVLPGIGCPQQGRRIRPRSTILIDEIHSVSRRLNTTGTPCARKTSQLAARRAPLR